MLEDKSKEHDYDLARRLSQRHIDEFRASGLSDATIWASQAQTVNDSRLWTQSLNWKSPDPTLGSALVYPTLDINGRKTEHLQVKPDTPLKARPGKKSPKYNGPVGVTPPVYFPPGTRAEYFADASALVIVTEGNKKTLCADQHKFRCVGLFGIWSWIKARKKDNRGKPIGPRELIDELTAVVTNGRPVYIAFDSDIIKDVKNAYAEYYFAEVIKSRGAIPKNVRIPAGPEGEKQGIDDFIVRHGAEAFAQLITDAATPTKPLDYRPIVILGTEEHLAVDDSIKALSHDEDLYQREGNFSRIKRIGPNGTPTLTFVCENDLRRRLTKCARIMAIVTKDGKQEQVDAHPAPWLIPQVSACPSKERIRGIVGVTMVPIICPDGSVICEEGYDEESLLYYDLANTFIEPFEGPISQDDAKLAIKSLLALIEEVPISDDAGRSVWLSFILSTIARNVINGPTPGHLFDSSIRAGGKNLCINAAGIISTGQTIPSQPFTPSQDETRKMVTSVAIAANPVVHVDNLPSGEPFGGAIWDCTLTSETWTDRILSLSKNATVRLNTVWAFSGNNIPAKSDTARRLIRCRIEPNVANPEDRTDFKHKDLLGHIKQHRAEYVRDAVAIVAGYLQAGRPDLSLGGTGTYSGWSTVVRSAIVWAGGADPWETNVKGRDDIDTEASELATLADSIAELDLDRHGITTGEAKKRYETSPVDYPRTTELIGLSGWKDGIDPRRLGTMCRKHKDRPLSDGRKIVASTYKGNNRWRV